MNTKNKYIVILISVHVLLIAALLIVVVSLGVDYDTLLLMDDGYYDSAGLLVQGKAPNSLYGLGYPCLLTVLYLFPRFLHPFLRLFMSILLTFGSIVVIFKIFRNYFTHKEIFWGGIVLIANPLYVHWMFRSRPEAPLVLLLGLVILYSQRYLQDKRVLNLLLASVFLALSIFTKPTFVLIPFFLLFLFAFMRSRKVFLLSITLGVISIASFLGTKKLVENRKKDAEYYHIPSIVASAFYVDAILKNHDFKTQYMYVENANGDTIRNPRLVPGDEWIENYEKRFGNSNPIMMSIRLACEKPSLVIQQLVANPFLAFSLSSTEFETFSHLLINLCAVMLSIYGIVKITDKSDILYVHLVILFSVYTLLVLIHSRGPYFVPIIPYLFVFAGRSLNRSVDFIKKVARH